MKTKIIFLLLFAAAINAQPQKGILIVSFGTSYTEARKLCIESIEKKVENQFTNFEICRAFTSKIIRKILKERDGIEVLSPERAIDKMIDEGCKEIYIQPLHIIPGHEYNEILQSINKGKYSAVKLTIGKPLLFSEKDYRAAINALKSQIDLFDGKSVVFVGHGTTHPMNAAYSQLQNMMREIKINAYVANIEGYPQIPGLIKSLKEAGEKDLVLMPLMVVAGDHATNDIGGNEEDSWKTILTKEGFNVEVYLHGLGENEGIQKIYTDHIKDLTEGKSLYE